MPFLLFISSLWRGEAVHTFTIDLLSQPGARGGLLGAVNARELGAHAGDPRQRRGPPCYCCGEPTAIKGGSILFGARAAHEREQLGNGAVFLRCLADCC